MTTTDDIPRPWLASYRAEVPHDCAGGEYPNLAAFLEAMFARHAALPAFRNFRRTLSFA